MAGVGPLATGDIPAVAQLFSRVYRPMRLHGRALAAFVGRKKVPLAA
jgi:hypothetical protein